MKLSNRDAIFHIPDGATEEVALSRTTHLGIGAHQDDLEIMAWHGILECWTSDTDWFTGVTVTDGAGSARSGPYATTTDDEMKAIRRAEQNKAADLGEYSAMIQLVHSSARTKDPKNAELVGELVEIIRRAKPRVVYTHNLWDKHDTHVAVTRQVIRAIRSLPKAERPPKVLGCEVWRNLDWTLDADKVAMDVSGHENMAAALVGLFDSQIAGGKRYDLATLGRWRANATYFSSHATDKSTSMIYALDMTEVCGDESVDPVEFALRHLDRFREDVVARIRKFG